MFAYTTVVNVIERPDGVKIAGFFIALIIFVSLLSRIARTTELRVERFEIDETAQRFLDEAAAHGTMRIITNHPEESNPEEYRREIAEHREDHNLPAKDPILFLEVEVCDASEFADVVKVEGLEIGGYRVLHARGFDGAKCDRCLSSSPPRPDGKNSAHVLPLGLEESNTYLFDYVAFGRGDTAPVTREVLRQAEPDEEKRPAIHVGGY